MPLPRPRSCLPWACPCGFGQEDAGVGAIRGFRTLHNDFVAEGTNLHGSNLRAHPVGVCDLFSFGGADRSVALRKTSSNRSVWSGRSKTANTPSRTGLPASDSGPGWSPCVVHDHRRALPSPKQSHEGAPATLPVSPHHGENRPIHDRHMDGPRVEQNLGLFAIGGESGLKSGRSEERRKLLQRWGGGGGHMRPQVACLHDDDSLGMETQVPCPVLARFGANFGC